MDLGQLGALPLTLGALVTMGALAGAVIKGYRWFLDEVKRVVSDAIAGHESKEAVWRTEVTRRLDEIDRKVDRLSEEK